jgi:DNA-binding LacI/PurR family transcriptional regulator
MLGHTLVVVHGKTHPSDKDWELYLDALRRNADVIDSQLVVTEGGSPNSAQRKASLELAAGHEAPAPPTAVVTSSVLARGAVKALSWIMKDRIRAFSRAEFDEACVFIGASAKKAALREVATRLRATLP